MKSYASTVSVASYPEEYLAAIAQARLLAAGIPAELSETAAFRWNPFAPPVVEEYTLLVPRHLEKKARAILKRRRA